MTEQLIEKLQRLDEVLHDARQHYQSTHTELNTLKSTPSADIEELNQVKQQLNDSQTAYEKSCEQHTELQNKFDQLDKEYQLLIDSHNELKDKHAEMATQVQALEEANQKLLEKNRLAREHTRVVYERLTKIDQA